VRVGIWNQDRDRNRHGRLGTAGSKRRPHAVGGGMNDADPTTRHPGGAKRWACGAQQRARGAKFGLGG